MDISINCCTQSVSPLAKADPDGSRGDPNRSILRDSALNNDTVDVVQPGCLCVRFFSSLVYLAGARTFPWEPNVIFYQSSVDLNRRFPPIASLQYTTPTTNQISYTSVIFAQSIKRIKTGKRGPSENEFWCMPLGTSQPLLRSKRGPKKEARLKTL